MKRICKDCYYFMPAPCSLPDKEYARCGATESMNLITGELSYDFCWIERESVRPEACGVAGKNYDEPEPREMWQRDEPQGATNWDTGWNGVHASEEGMSNG